MKRPFFSICIPTYNRSLFLIKSIKSVLKQKFRDYEIIISDNGSSDDTKEKVSEIKSKKIKYFRNTNNHGAAANINLAITRACGEYIFLLGDDDYILKDSTFTEIANAIKAGNYGYIRLKFIFKSDKNLYLDRYLNNLNRLSIKRRSGNLSIYNFIYSSIYQFISGIVFKNYSGIKKENVSKLIRNGCSDFTLKYIFTNCLEYGGLIDLKNPIIASISKYKRANFYYISDEKMPFEFSLDLISSFLNNYEYNVIFKKLMSNTIISLPVIKYYTDNRNVIGYAKRILKIDRKKILNLKFIIFLAISLIIPKFIWGLFRVIYNKMNSHGRLLQ